VPFLITYTLRTGTAVWAAHTAIGAVLAYDELKCTGAGAMTIRDERGDALSLEQLTLAATLLMKQDPDERDRDPGFSA
jgi:hypothetical protein